MSDKIKKMAIGISSALLAIAMGVQTFVFGQNDLQRLKADVTELSQRLKDLEEACAK